MTPRAGPSLHDAARRLSMASGALVAAMGLLTLIGWLAEVPLLRSPLPGRPEMKANSALAFLATGLSLVLLAARPRHPLGRTLAALSAALGALTLLEWLVPADFGIDQILARDAGTAPGTTLPGRMSPLTALAVLLMGCSLGLPSRPLLPRLMLHELLAFAALPLALLVLAAHSFDAVLFAPYTQMPLQAALGVIVLSAGVLALHPGRGAMEPVWRPDSTGAVARRLLPAALVFPLLIVFLRVLADAAGLLSFGTSLALLSLFNVALPLLLAAWAIQSVGQVESSRIRSETQYRSLVEASDDAILTVGIDGVIRSWNEAAARIYGYTATEAVGRPLGLLDAESDSPGAAKLLPQVLGGEQVRGVDARGRRKDGSAVDVALTLSPVPDAVGRVNAVSVISRDLGETRRIETQRTLFFDLSLDMLCIADFKGYFRHLNPAWERTLGWTREELMAKPFIEFVHPEDRERTIREAAALAEGGITVSFTNRYLCRDGSYRDFSWNAASSVQDGLIFAVARDVSVQRAAERELQRAREEAEGATRAKSAFLATMSHEIRTPLNAIIGMSQLLDESEDRPELREYVDTIRLSGEHLLALINDILDFSKIEAGKLELETSMFQVSQVVEQAQQIVAPRAHEKQLELTYEIDPDTREWVVGDPVRVRQILVNLLTNAVKFTERGEIAVHVSGKPQEGGRYRLQCRVEDTGIGIPRDKMRTLFDRFTQVDASSTRIHGGTGLGLAISKQLAELMGGGITVESEIGKGSSFSFWVDLEEAPSPPPPVRLGGLEGIHALVLDDNATNRRLLVLLLKRWGALPVEAPTPKEVQAMVANGVPLDVLLLDHHLPGMTGLALAAEIGRNPLYANAPILLLTSSPPHHSEIAKHGVRFDRILTKPIRQSDLFEALRTALAKRGTPPPAAERQAPAAPAARPLRILVAEDNPVNQKVALKLLERLGYQADLASNGEEALHRVTSDVYDAVLMDAHMPVMDGLEATRQILARFPVGNRPRIIAMTAEALKGDRERFLKVGMEDYIAKPVSLEELRRALDRVPRRDGMAASAPIDDARWRRFEEEMGNEKETIRGILGSLLDEAPRLMDTIQAASKEGNAREAHRAAHTLKSLASTVGALPLIEEARVLEELFRDGRMADAVPRIPSLATRLQAALTEIRRRSGIA